MPKFIRDYWPNYVVPVGGPFVVCVASFIGTNIGWIAFPLCVGMCAFMVFLTTMLIRSRERAIEQIMTAVKAVGTVKVVNREQR